MSVSVTRRRESGSQLLVTDEHCFTERGDLSNAARSRRVASLAPALAAVLILGCGGGKTISLDRLAASSSDAQLLPVGREVRVVTPTEPWARGAVLNLNLADVSDEDQGPTRLTIDLKVTEGTVGVGFLNPDGRGFLDEEFIRPSSDYSQVSLYLDSLSEASDLVVRNASIDGTASEALVRSITLKPQPPAGGRQQGQETPTGVDQSPVESSWLKKYLEAEIPELRDPSSADWQKINALRQWTYNNVPIALGPGVPLEEKYGYAVYDFDPQDILFLLSTNTGGYYCAGTAEFLATIYRTFGYEAYTYNMGQPEGPSSHVTTLVQFFYRGRQVTTVQDAFFNFRLMKNGEPLAFEDLLAALGRGEGAAIDLQTGNTDCKPAMAAPAGAEQYRVEYQAHYEVGPIAWMNGNARFCHNLSLQTFSVRTEYEQWLNERIGRKNFLYLFLFPISTSGEAEAEKLARESKQTGQHLLVRKSTAQ